MAAGLATLGPSPARTTGSLSLAFGCYISGTRDCSAHVSEGLRWLRLASSDAFAGADHLQMLAAVWSHVSVKQPSGLGRAARRSPAGLGSRAGAKIPRKKGET